MLPISLVLLVVFVSDARMASPRGSYCGTYTHNNNSSVSMRMEFRANRRMGFPDRVDLIDFPEVYSVYNHAGIMRNLTVSVHSPDPDLGTSILSFGNMIREGLLYLDHDLNFIIYEKFGIVNIKDTNQLTFDHNAQTIIGQWADNTTTNTIDFTLSMSGCPSVGDLQPFGIYKTLYGASDNDHRVIFQFSPESFDIINFPETGMAIYNVTYYVELLPDLPTVARIRLLDIGDEWIPYFEQRNNPTNHLPTTRAGFFISLYLDPNSHGSPELWGYWTYDRSVNWWQTTNGYQVLNNLYDIEGKYYGTVDQYLENTTINYMLLMEFNANGKMVFEFFPGGRIGEITYSISEMEYNMANVTFTGYMLEHELQMIKLLNVDAVSDNELYYNAELDLITGSWGSYGEYNIFFTLTQTLWNNISLSPTMSPPTMPPTSSPITMVSPTESKASATYPLWFILLVFFF